MSISGKGPDDLAITRDDGSPVGDFRRVWRKIATAAGLPCLLVHDLRRSGVRNLRRLGFAEKTSYWRLVARQRPPFFRGLTS